MNATPLLAELPPPPAGRTGWPWTQAVAPLPATLPGGTPWPRVTLVTPSFNQGRFLEETIRSVLLQGYPNLEYRVIDGGSADGSIEIIRKYAAWIDRWESAPDRGQTHAIMKGLADATGEVCGWLNSDDLFFPGALAVLMALRAKNSQAVAWVGACQEIDAAGVQLRLVTPKLGDQDTFGDWGFATRFYQPACLFSGAAFAQVGGLREELVYVMDVDLWLRLARAGAFAACDTPVAAARLHPEAKTTRDPYHRECELIAVLVNQGLRDVAAARFQRRLRRAKTRHLERLAPGELLKAHAFAAVADCIPFRHVCGYLARRAWRAVGGRVREDGAV